MPDANRVFRPLGPVPEAQAAGAGEGAHLGAGRGGGRGSRRADGNGGDDADVAAAPSRPRRSPLVTGRGRSRQGAAELGSKGEGGGVTGLQPGPGRTPFCRRIWPVRADSYGQNGVVAVKPSRSARPGWSWPRWSSRTRRRWRSCSATSGCTSSPAARRSRWSSSASATAASPSGAPPTGPSCGSTGSCGWPNRLASRSAWCRPPSARTAPRPRSPGRWGCRGRAGASPRRRRAIVAWLVDRGVGDIVRASIPNTTPRLGVVVNAGLTDVGSSTARSCGGRETSSGAHVMVSGGVGAEPGSAGPLLQRLELLEQGDLQARRERRAAS